MVFEPPDGGVPEHVSQLARYLPRNGWEVEVAGPAVATVYPRLAKLGVRAHRVEMMGRGWSSWWTAGAAAHRLRGIIQEGSFDLVHCHSSRAGFLGRLAARRAEVAVAYSPHCFGFVGRVSVPRARLVETTERALGRQTDALICACDAELRLAQKRRICDPERRWRVYYGTEACDAEDHQAHLPAFNGGGSVVGTITVLREQKRIDVLIEAAPRILAQVPDATIAIVGNGPLRSRLTRQAAALKLHREARFRFLPFTPPPHRYLRRLDLFILPSDWEAMPISILEALACGVPQVATEVDGIVEAVSAETGVLVPSADSDRLAEAVVQLLRDPDRRAAMSRASIARHRELFRADRMSAETAEVYNSII